jgi:hypothetical protein
MVALMASLGGPNLDELRHAFFGLGFVVLAFAAASALIVSLLGILYMAVVVAPNATQRFSGALRERNLASLLTGLPVMGVFAVSGAITHRSAGLSGVAFLVFAVSVILAFTAAAEDVGRRLFWACGREGSRAAQLATGWLVLAFGSLFPVIGWFLILPYALLSGLGSLVLGSFPRRPEPARAPVES